MLLLTLLLACSWKMDQARNSWASKERETRHWETKDATVYDLKPFMTLNNYTPFDVFNTILHEASIPRGDVHNPKGLTIACYFTELWPFY